MNKKQKELLKEANKALFHGRGKQWREGTARLLAAVRVEHMKEWEMRWETRVTQLRGILANPTKFPRVFVAEVCLSVVEAAKQLGQFNAAFSKRMLDFIVGRQGKKGKRRAHA